MSCCWRTFIFAEILNGIAPNNCSSIGPVIVCVSTMAEQFSYSSRRRRIPQTCHLLRRCQRPQWGDTVEKVGVGQPQAKFVESEFAFIVTSEFDSSFARI